MKIILAAKIAGTSVGHIDHALGYAAGLMALGHEVYLMDHAGSGRCTLADATRVAFSAWPGRQHFEQVARNYGLWPRCCLIYKNGAETFGMSYDDAVRVAKDCDLLISRSGQIENANEIFEAARCRVFIDGNPGSTQVQFVQCEADLAALSHYHHFFTMGLNIGSPGNAVPTGGLNWQPICRPVPLPSWPSHPPSGTHFTTISTWRGRGTFNWQETASGEKSDNWIKVLELPSRTAQTFEIAMNFAQSEEPGDRDMFLMNGWALTDPAALQTQADYREFIAKSRGEFSIAHNRYAAFNTGWFSDRSALYLACGRPVLVQSTGIETHLPTGLGLLTFTNLDNAIAGIDSINTDYDRHCAAARDICETYFAADKVCMRLLDAIGT